MSVTIFLTLGMFFSMKRAKKFSDEVDASSDNGGRSTSMICIRGCEAATDLVYASVVAVLKGNFMERIVMKSLSS